MAWYGRRAADGPLPGNGRRRVAAIVLAAALVLLAIGLAVLLPRPAGSPSPLAAPSPSPSQATSSPATPPPAATETEAPDAGQTPVQPPVIMPPAPATTPCAPGTVPPQDPFPAGLRNQDLTAIPGAGRAVALTFDAGANAAGLPKILSALSAKGVAATFFLTGNWAG